MPDAAGWRPICLPGPNEVPFLTLSLLLLPLPDAAGAQHVVRPPGQLPGRRNPHRHDRVRFRLARGERADHMTSSFLPALGPAGCSSYLQVHSRAVTRGLPWIECHNGPALHAGTVTYNSSACVAVFTPMHNRHFLYINAISVTLHEQDAGQ